MASNSNGLPNIKLTSRLDKSTRFSATDNAGSRMLICARAESIRFNDWAIDLSASSSNFCRRAASAVLFALISANLPCPRLKIGNANSTSGPMLLAPSNSRSAFNPRVMSRQPCCCLTNCWRFPTMANCCCAILISVRFVFACANSCE